MVLEKGTLLFDGTIDEASEYYNQLDEKAQKTKKRKSVLKQ